MSTTTTATTITTVCFPFISSHQQTPSPPPNPSTTTGVRSPTVVKVQTARIVSTATPEITPSPTGRASDYGYEPTSCLLLPHASSMPPPAPSGPRLTPDPIQQCGPVSTLGSLALQQVPLSSEHSSTFSITPIAQTHPVNQHQHQHPSIQASASACYYSTIL
ncbi:hypothetical protein BZA05DRAFT_392295 [Tricharina praecox]|uniref:uncharacterized protein n=1 Tax=Tricharina praecox TaxID=43433 RepID=UPI00221F1E53|nr:uncharacterized protein BZA05DRAFT_392295 [Tricharina praecox]KAI5854707.1 hypothetical protein BZA05DRAFT_392295 [Tricharina praecox]